MNGWVRGEGVKILREDVPHEEKHRSGILGATVREASTLVEYPDGEWGYVKPEEVRKDGEEEAAAD